MQKLALIAACGLAAGCAAAEGGRAGADEDRFAPATASAEQPDCFNSRFINGYSEVDRDTIRVRVGQDDYYDVDVTGACMDLEWSNRLAVVTRSRSNLCVGPAFGDAEIITRDDACSVLQISHSPRRPASQAMMTPSENAAD